MLRKHKSVLSNVLKDETTLDELTDHFIVLVRETIIPFIKRIHDLYYSKIDLTLEEQVHLKDLKDIVTRYLHFEIRVIEHIHNREIKKSLAKEIEDVKKITQDVQKLDIDELQKDFEELQVILESVHVRLKKTIEKSTHVSVVM